MMRLHIRLVVLTLLQRYAYPPPLVLSSIEAILVDTFTIAALEQLRPPLGFREAADFNRGRNAYSREIIKMYGMPFAHLLKMCEGEPRW